MQNNELPDILLDYLNPGKVVIFAYSYCPYCTKATELLSNLNIQPEIFYIDKEDKLKNNKTFKNMIDEHSGIVTFPKIYAGLSCVGGYTDLYDLFTKNKLFEILKSEGIEFMEEDFY